MTVNNTVLPSPPGFADSEWELRQGHIRVDGEGVTMTNTIRPAGRGKPERRPGRRLIWGSVVLLAGLAGVAFYVSFQAQFRFVLDVKHLQAAAVAEAVIPDAGMAICALAALAMAVQGRAAKTARMAVVGFAGLSAVMNYEAANSYSAHAVTVYVMPAVAFAVCTDLVVSVVRRFYYGVEDEASPWAPLGRAVAAGVRAAGVLALYALRFCLDREQTWRGLRQLVLNAAPLPAPPERGVAAAEPTKKERLIELYQAHPARGDRARCPQVAAELAPLVPVHPGTARKYLAEYVNATPT